MEHVVSCSSEFLKLHHDWSKNSFKHYAKTRICRVLSIEHTTKKLLVMCTHSKNIIHGKVMLCCVFLFGALPCAFFWRKAMLWCVFYLGIRQSKHFFLSSHLKTFSTIHIQHMVLHVKILYIFMFICYI